MKPIENETLSDVMMYDQYPAQLGMPENEDCTDPYLPERKGKKKLIVADPVSMTKYFFDHYRLPMYSFLNACRRNGTLSSLVGADVLNPKINRSVCCFPNITFWRVSRNSFYADVNVELKLKTTVGEIVWKGFITHFCYFDNGFAVQIEDLTDEVNREGEGCILLSAFLVPYCTCNRMDTIAEKIWLNYCPTGLNNPKRDAVELAEKMGLQVQYHRVYEHRNVEGIIFFAEDELVVGDDYYDVDENGNKHLVKTSFPEKITVPAGTIVVNINKIKRDYSQYRIYHECIHYEMHYLYFCLQQMCSDDPRKMKTKEIIVDDNEQAKDPVYFMEKQADRGAYGLMMPEKHTRELVAEECKNITEYRHVGEKLEKIGKAISIKLLIPHFRIRARLIQLGYLEAKGSLNYVEKKLIQPFAFNLDSWRENIHTFVIDRDTLNGICRRNDDLRNMIDSKDYIYADGHVVRNTAKCVEKKNDTLVLTDYANSHVDDCCLRFTRYYEQEYLGRFVYGKMYYDPHLVERTEFFLKDVINEKQLDIVEAKEEYIKAFPAEFKDAFQMLLTQCGDTQENLSPELGTTKRSLYEWVRKPETKVISDFVIYISLLWELPDWISSLLMETACVKMNLKLPRYRALEHIRTVMWDQGVDAANRFLKERGFEPLHIKE